MTIATPNASATSSEVGGASLPEKRVWAMSSEPQNRWMGLALPRAGGLDGHRPDLGCQAEAAEHAVDLLVEVGDRPRRERKRPPASGSCPSRP